MQWTGFLEYAFFEVYVLFKIWLENHFFTSTSFSVAFVGDGWYS